MFVEFLSKSSKKMGKILKHEMINENISMQNFIQI